MKNSFLNPFFFILVSTLGVFANVSINIDKNPSLGESFTLTISAPTNVLPRGGYETPIVAADSSYEITNIKEGRNKDFFSRMFTTFTFKIKALKGGTLTVGPISWVVGGKTHDLGTKNVKVERGLDQPGLGVWLSANKKKLYVGEQTRLSLQYNIYENYIGGLDPSSITFGKHFLGGLHKDSWKEKQSSKDYIRVKAYQTAYIAPLNPGKIILDKHKFLYEKQGKPERKVVEKKMGGTSFRSETIIQENIKSQAFSNSIEFVVLPLPTQGKPKVFNEMVGQFKMKLKSSHDTLELGNALTLNLNIEGNGKPGYISSPLKPSFENFREIPPEKSKSKFYSKGYLWTKITEKFYLYPKTQGQLIILPFEFNYFDPEKQRYIRLKTDTINLFVKPPKAEATSVSEDFRKINPIKEEIKLNLEEVKYLSLNPQASKKRFSPAYQNKFFYIVWIFIILTIVFAYIKTYTKIFNSIKGGNHSNLAKLNKIEKKITKLLFENKLKEIVESIKKLSESKALTYENSRKDFEELISNCDFHLYANKSLKKEQCEELLSQYHEIKIRHSEKVSK